MMTVLAILPSDAQANPGDLHAQVQDGKLLIPAGVARRFQGEGVRTADDLLSYMQAFPSAVADLLKWQSADVSRAALLLSRLLRDHPSPTQQTGQSASNPPLGAFDPDDLAP